MASALSRSALFAQIPIPVVVRFSVPHGNPNSRNARQMELEFRLPGGSVQHMAMLSTPLFGTSDAVTFGEMIVAVKPNPNTGEPDLQRLQEFLAAHPDAFAQSNFVTDTDPPSSFASSAYFSIHTLRFIDAEGRTRFVRWRFLPQDGESTASPSELTAQDAVQKRFNKRLATGPVRWDMIVYVGEPADTTDNASIAWPEERMHLNAGTLTITKPIPDSAAQCARMTFDPLIFADGIAPADDPVLLFRSPVYARAFAARLARALASTHAAPVVDQ
jgi:catalase